GVMDGRRYAGLFQFGLHLVAVGDHDGVLRPDAVAVGPYGDGAGPGWQVGQQAAVAGADFNALADFPFKAFELAEHHGALQGVHAAAHADPRVVVPGRLAVYADFATSLGDRVVIGEDGAAVAIAAQRLAGEEAGASDGGQVAALAALVRGAEALRGVFDDGNAVARGDGIHFVHVAHLAVQRHRHDGLGARRDLGFDQRGIDITGVGLDVDEYRPGAQQHDDFGGGHEGKRRGDDFVARPDAQRHQRHEQ